jgi:signal transduction histidine kinase
MSARGTAQAVRAPHLPPPAIADNGGAEFAAPLTGPNGLELVVEMAHDLRSPLTAIAFLADALHQGQSGPINEAQRRALGLIYSAALGLCTTTSDVLELARGGTQLVDREPVPFSIVDLMTSVRDMILPLAVEKRLEVRLVHPVPERRLGHPRALSRVLLNLATNAAKFTDAGYVEISARPLTRTRLEFSVRDTGNGFGSEIVAAPAGSKPAYTSAGLGLAICRRLVKAMGSELDVETVPDQGSRFFFALEAPAASVAV